MLRLSVALLLLFSLVAGCARESVLRPQQVLGIRALPDGELVYPTPDGGEVIPPDADLTILVRPGGAFELEERGLHVPQRGGPHGTAIAVDVVEDDFWGSPRGVGARIGEQRIFVPIESVGWMSVREERNWGIVVVSAVVAAALPLGLMLVILTDVPDY